MSKERILLGVAAVVVSAGAGVCFGEPVIEVWPGELNFTAVEGGSNPTSQILYIRNDGTGNLQWEITETSEWLSATPKKGNCVDETDEIEVRVNVGGLSVGEYSSELTISDPAAVNDPQVVEVNLSVRDGGEGLWVPYDYSTIQAAIDAAVDGDTVIVADGIYTGEGNRDIDFLGKAITVRSENGPEDCVIECESSRRGFIFQSGEDTNSVLDGFSIINGYTSENGGGIYCYYSSPTVVNCAFSGNTAYDNLGFEGEGGGMGNFYSSPTVINCIFRSNSAQYGGGMSNYNSSPIVTNCTFINCSSYYYGGGMYNWSGETVVITSPTVTNCTFISNWSHYDAGGMCNDNSILTVINCIFRSNSGEYGGGMYNYDSGMTVTNCTFSNNTANIGSGMYNLNLDNWSSSSQFTNCTFSSNSAYKGGGMYNDDSSPMVTNCILWGNTPNEIYNDDTSSSIVTYSDVEGNYIGMGNIDDDPLFVDPNNGDYHLKSEVGRWDADLQEWVIDNVTSSCIDAGDPTSDHCGELWPNGGRINMGAYGGTSEASMSLSDAGSAADMNCDDGVDMEDFGELSSQWQKQEILLKEDIDRDGEVGFSDLVMFCEEWML